MLDVNLGNKTLVIGVLIALILSYGMVNFDSGSTAATNVPAIQTAHKEVVSAPLSMADASSRPAGTPGHLLKAPTSVTVEQAESDPSIDMLEEPELERRKQHL